jgi:hypothetical protein
MLLQGSVEWMLRAWELAILRFAVTRDDADRLCVLEIAGDLDAFCFGNGQARDFHFFRRTSNDVCAAILQPSDSSLCALQVYLKRVDDVRLRRATAAALKSDRKGSSAKERSKENDNLWAGLNVRNHALD